MYIIPNGKRLSENPKMKRKSEMPNLVTDTHHIKAPTAGETRHSEMGYSYGMGDGSKDGNKDVNKDEDKDEDKNEDRCTQRRKSIA